jgi:hypothetical protein
VSEILLSTFLKTIKAELGARIDLGRKGKKYREVFELPDFNAPWQGELKALPGGIMEVGRGLLR